MKKTFVVSATIAAMLIAGVSLAMVSGGSDESSDESRVTTTLVDHDKEVVVSRESEPDDHDDDVVEKESDEPEVKPEPKEEKGEQEESEDTAPPDFEILYPKNEAHFTETHLAFEGVVEPGSKVFAAGYEADVDEEGNWRIVLILSPGGNLAKFTAVDEAGNESFAQVKVFLDVVEEEEPKEESEFVAYQKYGSCGEEAPYDVFYGSGTPGTGVWVGSDFGSGQTEVGENGKWELKVYFEEAPCNKAFAVVVESDDGYRKVFEFFRVCEEPKEEGSD